MYFSFINLVIDLGATVIQIFSFLDRDTLVSHFSWVAGGGGGVDTSVIYNMVLLLLCKYY